LRLTGRKIMSELYAYGTSWGVRSRAGSSKVDGLAAYAGKIRLLKLLMRRA